MSWYWCLRHSRPEPADQACGSQDRLGPYATREEAANWKDRVEARTEEWEADDRAWYGEDERG